MLLTQSLPKLLDQTRCWFEKIKAPKIMAPKNLVKIGDIPNMDSWHLLKMVPGTYHQSFIKNDYVIAEIFLI